MYNSDRHHRRSIRLKGYDYSRPGDYFVTVCVQNRGCLLGDVVEGKMKLNAAGEMIHRVWNELPIRYPGIEIDEFVIMPNHIHGIIMLVGAGPRACPPPGRKAYHDSEKGPQTEGQPQDNCGQPQGVAPTVSMSDAVHRFKSFSTAEYRKGVNQYGWTPFPGRFWQRNYYEHIIRDEKSLNKIRRYIQANPLMWPYDAENTDRISYSIDRVLAQHYGFSDEELDFIINYDIKYRMGRDGQDETYD